MSNRSLTSEVIAYGLPTSILRVEDLESPLNDTAELSWRMVQANTTSWSGGNLNSGLGWVSILSAVSSLGSGSAILDNTDVTNGTGLDIFCDISMSGTIGSNTIAAGANFAFWIYMLNQDGTSYGDNHQSTTASANVPSDAPDAVIPLFAAAAQTSIVGSKKGLQLPPGTFRWVVQNNCGFNATGLVFKFRTYNTNLNR